jgi:hypothetical protein
MTLILTFSLMEKELPLPEGEGWGEGNPGAAVIANELVIQ